MGFFDLASPLLSSVDYLLAFVLPETLRIGLWSLLASMLTMKLYARFSRQEEIAGLKPEIKKAQRALAKYDGEFSGLWPLMATSFRLSFRHIGMTLKPALIASVPVLFILVWASNQFSYDLPNAGDRIAVTAAGEHPDHAQDLSWSDNSDAQPTALGWSVRWPDDDVSISLDDPWTGVVLELPTPAPTGVVHKHQWWNWLTANPGGYLADNTAPTELIIDLPRKLYLPWGPEWMQGWEALFLILLVIFSLSLKFIWKIH